MSVTTKPLLNPYADRAEMVRALRLFGPPGAVRELRILGVPGTGTISGYFNDPDLLADQAMLWAGKAKGIYTSLNALPDEALARLANRVETHVKTTTSDGDIARRLWLPLDGDPSRISGISSTDDEHERSIDYIRKATDWLKDVEGWPEAILLDSGNGGHALLPLDLPNDEASKLLIEGCVNALADRFDGDGITLDRKVFNASRVWKLPGSVARKGDSLPERRHRVARILSVPEDVRWQ